VTIQQGDGGGEVKLGTNLELEPNVFTLAFVALFRAEYVEKVEREEEEEEEKPSTAENSHPVLQQQQQLKGSI